MNKAFRHVLVWYFGQTDVADEESAEIIGLIEAGIRENEAETAAILVSILQQAETMATDEANETVLELIEIGKKLVIAENALGKADNLIAIRSIMDLPKANPIMERIRAFRIREHAEALRD